MTKEYPSQFEGPSAVDLLITDKCQLDCVCFRPPRTGESKTLSLEEWKEIIGSCSSVGVKHVIFSGNEPLLSPDLSHLLIYTKELGLRTTLSTNAILFEKHHRSIMPHIDDIGIPIDGPTPEINAVLRPPARLNQFQKALDAINTVQNDYPMVDLTLRTVVSSINMEHVLQIPNTLKDNGVDTSELKWKLYQFNPAVPEPLSSRAEEMTISTSSFLGVCAKVREKYGRSFGGPRYYPIAVAEKEHFLVYPDGEASILVGTNQTQDEYDHLPRLQYERLGNISKDFDNTMAQWSHGV